jgi:hypothetical protein
MLSAAGDDGCGRTAAAGKHSVTAGPRHLLAGRGQRPIASMEITAVRGKDTKEPIILAITLKDVSFEDAVHFQYTASKSASQTEL